MNRLAPDSLLWSGWSSTMSKKKPFPAPQQAPALQARTASLLWELALRARFASAPRVYSGSLRCKPALRARTATRPASLRCEPTLWCYQPELRVRPITLNASPINTKPPRNQETSKKPRNHETTKKPRNQETKKSRNHQETKKPP